MWQAKHDSEGWRGRRAKRGDWVQTGDSDEHMTSDQPSNFCAGLCSPFWIGSTSSPVLRRNKRQSGEMRRWKIQQMCFLYPHIWWNPRLGSVSASRRAQRQNFWCFQTIKLLHPNKYWCLSLVLWSQLVGIKRVCTVGDYDTRWKNSDLWSPEVYFTVQQGAFSALKWVSTSFMVRGLSRATSEESLLNIRDVVKNKDIKKQLGAPRGRETPHTHQKNIRFLLFKKKSVWATEELENFCEYLICLINMRLTDHN